jgi:hypothetical protein
MKLEELRKLANSEPKKFMAVPKNGDRPHSELQPFVFTLRDVSNNGVETVIFDPNKPGKAGHLLSECHIHQFTGLTDSEKNEVYGGHIVTIELPSMCWLLLVYWDSVFDGWKVKNIKSGRTNFFSESESGITSHSAGEPFQKLTIVGHIDQPDRWPEEVRELLEVVK